MTTVAEDLTPHLQRFGLSQFRPGQEEVIRAVLERRDCLCIMPTGGGKSLCYQLPAVAREGVTLVVSPLIALMKDQVDQLTAMGISASFINSSLSIGEQRDRLQRMSAGEFDLLYVAPERLRNEMFIESVRAVQVQLLAVDEAHCVSEWGHDFRPDYARIGRFREQLGSPQTIALTATATPKVRSDVVDLLRLKSPQVFVSGFTRPNLQFAVEQAGGAKEKGDRLLALLQTRPGPGIVYAATRKGCEEVAELIGREMRCPVGLYHAGLLNDERRQVQERFMRGDLDVIVATNAFGMGINKVNLRFVVHYNMPGSLEAYYQEAGRAGRDGLPARCLLLFSFSDRYIQEFFIDNNYPARQTVKSVYEYLRSIREDPIELTLQELRERLDLGVGTEAISASEQILEKAKAIKRLDSQQNRASVWIESDLPTLVDLLPKESKTRRNVLRAVERLVGDRRHERVTFQLERVAAMAEVDRSTVSRTLRELSQLKAFDYVPPFRGRAVHLLKPNVPFSQLNIDFQDLEDRKRAEYEKLDRMIAYAQTRRCRQAEILDYFGEKQAFRCGTCDTCGPLVPLAGSIPAVRAADAPDEPLLRMFRMALSGVARGNSRFGKQMIAQMLAGSNSSKIQKHRLDQLSTFGLLNFLTQSEVVAVLDELHRQALVEQSEVDRYRPILQLTTLGGEVMRGRTAPPQPVQLPAGVAIKVAQALGGESPDNSPHSAADPGGPGLAEPQNPRPDLMRTLREWRKEKAHEAMCPPYRIVPTSVLEQLASAPCLSLNALLQIRGVGPSTVERFGDELLEMLTHYWRGEESEQADSAGAEPVGSPASPELDGESSSSPTSSSGTSSSGAPSSIAEPPLSPTPDVVADLEQSPRQGSSPQVAAQHSESIEPPSARPPDDQDTNRSYYWTWRLLTAGFRPRECASIRRLGLDDVYRDAVSAYEHGLDIELGWLFTGEELEELREGRKTLDTSANPDANPDENCEENPEEKSKENPREFPSEGSFSAEQWRAFCTLSGP